ncbi:hypothetical protein ACFVKB_49515 [Rhodococcus sp. NPDC127530]|uniref:hypothetical protein n=1 Tax=Rhodococcus sp. NPDC127530 TaxID=3345397 RepID=UPI003643B9E3
MPLQRRWDRFAQRTNTAVRDLRGGHIDAVIAAARPPYADRRARQMPRGWVERGIDRTLRVRPLCCHDSQQVAVVVAKWSTVEERSIRGPQTFHA